jgi:trans-aconitate 2-methyltransferase
MSPPREWDAASYDRVSTPQQRWAIPVLEHLAPDGVTRVLDAGCGSGRVTQAIVDRLPQAHVVALDGSQQMLDEAARRLSAAVDAGRVSFVHADLGLPLPIDQPVDAVVSTAAFHWVSDHDALFANLAAVLRPGGQLVAQCGGAGNVASVVQAMATLGVTWNPWQFATPAETTRRMEAAGFESVRAWLHDEPTAFEPGAPLEEFLSTVVLGAHLEGLRPAERQPFVRSVTAALPGPVIDYVRLNLVAVRSGG